MSSKKSPPSDRPPAAGNTTLWNQFNIKIESLPAWSLLLLAALLYTPLAFLGYGSDSDSFSVVRVGLHFFETLDYVPSRLPGFFVHEVFVYILNGLGGSLLSNLGSVVMALITLYSFRKLCVIFQVPHATVLTLILMVQPFFWVSAASTIDYVWALGFCFLGYLLLYRRKYAFAAISLAAAIGSRLTSVVLVGFFLLYLFVTYREMRKQLVFTALAIALLSFVFYIPPIDFLEWNMSRWLVLSTGDPELWTPLLRFGRFFYKNLMFFSIPVVLWGLFMGFYSLKTKKPPRQLRRDGVIWLSLAVIVAVQALFLRFPIEMEYLLPLLPFALILTGKYFPKSTWHLWLLFALVLLSNFLWINPARSINPNQTSEVVYGLWLEPGYLLQDIAVRLAQLNQ